MAKATLRIEYDGGGHTEFVEVAPPTVLVPDLDMNAVLLAQTAFQKALRAAGLAVPTPEAAEPEAAPDPATNGKADAASAAAAVAKGK